MKKLISLLLVLCLASALLSTAALAEGFVDIEAGSYYEKAVYWAVANDITRGTTYSTFSPNEGCTRGQMVTFLWRCAGSPKPADGGEMFTDVNPEFYYADAIRWALQIKITAGMGENTFQPDGPCTRGQIVTFLYRSAGEENAVIATEITPAPLPTQTAGEKPTA